MITILHTCDYMHKDAVTGDYHQIKADNAFLAKRITSLRDSKPASMVRKFRLGKSYKDIWTLDDLLKILIPLENNPHACVIRYRYHSAKEGDTVFRRASEFVNDKSYIVAVDVDSLDLPKGMSSTDILSQGKYVTKILHDNYPDFFNEDTGFIAQASSSAGLSNKIKLHMWFKNKSPVSQQQIKNAMYVLNTKYKENTSDTDPLIDLALYSQGQIHYTSAPIFTNATDNPFRNKPRTVYHKGQDIFIPATFPEYVQPVQATKAELSEYLDSVEGSLEPNAATEKFFDIVRGWNPAKRGLRTKVIALYHNAIQSQYSLELLDKEVFYILKVLRPGQEQKYIDEAKNAAMNYIKACSGRNIHDKVLGLPISNISGGTHERFLQVDNFPNQTAVFLKASLGTGKTATIERMLTNKTINGTFLAITDTSALVEANASRFNALDFRNPDNIRDYNQGVTDRLSGTLHSLYKLSIADRNFDFIFIDEADSVLNTLLFASIISDARRLQIVDMLSTLFNKANKIVFSDGDLSHETIQSYVDLMEGSKSIAKIIHTRKNLKGVRAFRHKSKQSLWGAVAAALSVGEKCLVVSDSSPDTLNMYQDVFKNDGLNVEVAHANSKLDPITRDVINHTTDALKRHKIDGLLCSPSITNGVDFNYFDTVFVLTTTDIHSPNMRFQALMRERQPKIIHYYITPTIRGFETGYSNLSIDMDWVNTGRKLVSSRKEREYKVYGATFNYYLVKAGCSIGYVDEPFMSPLEEADKERYLDEKASAMLKAAEGVIVPRHNRIIETYRLLQYMWKIDIPTYEECRKFLVDDPVTKMHMFHSIANEFWDVIKQNDPILLKETLLSERGHKFYLLTGMSIRSRTPREILDSCGLIDSVDLKQYVEMYKRFCACLSVPIAENVNKSDEFVLELGAI